MQNLHVWDTGYYKGKFGEALRAVVNHLGPNHYACPNCCEGCQVEMHEALRIAKEALGYTDVNEDVLGRITDYVRRHELGVPIETITRRFKLTKRDTDTFIATLEGRGIIRKLRGDPYFVKAI